MCIHSNEVHYPYKYLMFNSILVLSKLDFLHQVLNLHNSPFISVFPSWFLMLNFFYMAQQETSTLEVHKCSITFQWSHRAYLLWKYPPPCTLTQHHTLNFSKKRWHHCWAFLGKCLLSLFTTFYFVLWTPF